MAFFKMRNITFISSLIFYLSVVFAQAAEFKIADDLLFVIEPVEGWTLHLQDPPDSLVKEYASHVAHEPAAANASPEKIELVARNRLLANEAIIYHEDSGAHLYIDHSPYSKGDPLPNSKNLAKSAEFAGESLANEDDVSEAVSTIKQASFNGLDSAYLLSATFLKHDEPMIFHGYIGGVANDWLYLYFTSPADRTEVIREMETMLETAAVRVLGD